MIIFTDEELELIAESGRAADSGQALKEQVCYYLYADRVADVDAKTKAWQRILGYFKVRGMPDTIKLFSITKKVYVVQYTAGFEGDENVTILEKEIE